MSHKKWILLSALTLVLAVQASPLNRRYVPITVLGKQLPAVETPTSQLAAFAFSAVDASWTAVPWQVDDIIIENNVRKYNKAEAENDRIDAEDELLLMPHDLGDRAPTDLWLATADSVLPRIEIALHDPLDGQQAWIYLFAVTAETWQPPNGYFSHTPGSAEQPAADWWHTPAYTLGLSANGWIDFVALSLDPQLDILDRLKLRLAGKPGWPGYSAYSYTEDVMLWKKSAVRVKPVRSFQDQETLITNPLNFGAKFLSVDYKLHYYPYSYKLVVPEDQLDSSLSALFGIKTLRQSLDFSPAISGARFYSDSTTSDAIAIDGQPDALTTALGQQIGDPVWMMVSGAFGSVVSIYRLPNVKGAPAQLYYADRSDGGTADGTADSGDNLSFCDSGLLFQTQEQNQVLVSDRITLDFATYFISAAWQGPELAQNLVTWEDNDLQISAETQHKTASTAVTTASAIPAAFALEPAYPNPFDPSRSILSLAISGPAAPIEIVITDIRGCEIRRFVRERTERATVVAWDGTDQRGHRVASGIYLVWAAHLGQTQTAKILLLTP